MSWQARPPCPRTPCRMQSPSCPSGTLSKLQEPGRSFPKAASAWWSPSTAPSLTRSWPPYRQGLLPGRPWPCLSHAKLPGTDHGARGCACQAHETCLWPAHAQKRVPIDGTESEEELASVQAGPACRSSLKPALCCRAARNGSEGHPPLRCRAARNRWGGTGMSLPGP